MRRLPLLPSVSLLICALGPAVAAAQPSPAANSAFNAYIATVESRLAQQHRTPASFLAPMDASQRSDLRRGQVVVNHIVPPGDDPPGAIIHHWRGTAFAPGAHVADFDRIMRDFSSYPRIYAPQVVRARILSQRGDNYQFSMRLRQQQVVVIVFDTAYDVAFARLDPQHLYSLSRSTQVSEIDSPGTSHEHPLSPADDHGFLWRINTYWSCEERDGGLYLQIESVSLTRSVPAGLAWAVRPFIDTVPRSSLEFTLRSAITALRK
jgi:hypothetical protein